MAMNDRCTSCNSTFGPEDFVNGFQVAQCWSCRRRADLRAAAAAEAAAANPFAVKGRQEKAIAMAVVIDDNFRTQFPNLCPFDQAFRILDASRGWNDATWERIAVQAGYKPKAVSPMTREAVQGIYRGRATAPLAARNAS